MPEAAVQPEIPNKLYFRIGDVSRLAGVKPYVLRYWETEFPAIAPRKTDTGHRLYRRKDVELILEIRDLLYVRRFTIEGARKAMATRSADAPPAAPLVIPELSSPVQPTLFDLQGPDLKALRQELTDILNLLR